MRALFGHLGDGTPIHALTLESRSGLRAEILEYGGILRSLTLPGREGRTPLVLSLPDLDTYVRDRCYVGVIAGRYANRIAEAHFCVDGTQWALSANDGVHHLHGGIVGLGKRVWRTLYCVDGDTPRAVLGYQSPHCEEGYPGNLDIRVEFTLQSNRLSVSFETRCDATGPIGLTYHPYFNLAGNARVPAAEQRLRVFADHYLPVEDGTLIPTGEIASVEGTPLDFRHGKTLALPEPGLASAGGYDHCLIPSEPEKCGAELHSAHSGITMQIRSDLPALQVYGGQWLDPQYRALGDGICLEPQEYPNAPNESRFPSPILKAGETRTRRIHYDFF